jgi:hypothetical protein
MSYTCLLYIHFNALILFNGFKRLGLRQSLHDENGVVDLNIEGQHDPKKIKKL